MNEEAAEAPVPGDAAPEWICVDCTAECEDRSHAWIRARRIVREDGTVAWEFAAEVAAEVESAPSE